MGRVGCHTMRVGLVLGAGGVIGGAWLMGALEALEAETGWRAADAEQIVGTSAGAVIGALAAAGVPPEDMSAYAAADTPDDLAAAEERAAAAARRRGALAGAGVPPEYMSASGAGDRRDAGAGAGGGAAGGGGGASAGDSHVQGASPPIGPGSWRLAMSTLLQPHRHSPTTLIA